MQDHCIHVYVSLYNLHVYFFLKFEKVHVFTFSYDQHFSLSLHTNKQNIIQNFNKLETEAKCLAFGNIFFNHEDLSNR